MDNFIKRVITICLSLFLIAYVGYQCYRVAYNPVKTQEVHSVSVYDTIDTEGIIVRNETLITGKKNGYLFYTIENGGRVSKNGIIAKVFPSEADSRSQQQLDRLNREIDQLKEIQRQGSAGRVNLELIDKQIRGVIGELTAGVNRPIVKGVSSLQSQLLALMNKRQITIGHVSNFESRIAALTELKNDLVSSFSVATKTFKSPVAGYFVNSVDGYEKKIDHEKVTQLTVSKLHGLMNNRPKVSDDNIIGKVVGDYKWYLACIVPVSESGELRQGFKPEILLPFVTDDVIPSNIIAVNRGTDGNVAVIFECSYMSSELSSIRHEPVQIRLKRYEGLRVQSDCIITNDEGEQGVYVLSGGRVEFRRVEVLHAMPDYIICKQTDKTGYLRIYDDLIVKGKGLYDGKTVG